MEITTNHISIKWQLIYIQLFSKFSDNIINCIIMIVSHQYSAILPIKTKCIVRLYNYPRKCIMSNCQFSLRAKLNTLISLRECDISHC